MSRASTDERLRTLERRAENGDADAAVALLRVRMRMVGACEKCEGTGTMVPDREGKAFLLPCSCCHGTGQERPNKRSVELAAHCGNEAARAVLEKPDPECPGAWGFEADSVSFLVWVGALRHWGHTTLVRAAVAAARVALMTYSDHRCSQRRKEGKQPDFWARPCRCEEHEAPRRAIEATEAWINCPCDEHLPLENPMGGAWGNEPEEMFGAVLMTLWRENAEHWLGRVCAGSAEYTSEEAVRAAICDEIVPWALGTGDPVRDRSKRDG